MAETKTRPTDADVDAFLDSAEPAARAVDGHRLRRLFEDITSAKAVMWGPSIVGFGSSHYRYASGHEGDAPRVGFSPRKANLVLYVGGYEGFNDDLALLGKHKRSVACLYLTRLEAIDLTVLERIVRRSWENSSAGCTPAQP